MTRDSDRSPQELKCLAFGRLNVERNIEKVLENLKNVSRADQTYMNTMDRVQAAEAIETLQDRIEKLESYLGRLFNICDNKPYAQTIIREALERDTALTTGGDK